MTFHIATPTLPLCDSDLAHYPIRRIICIGRNYADHAKEMGQVFIAGTNKEAPPFFFYKPLTALYPVTASSPEPQLWPKPNYSQNIHHELEVCVAIGHKISLNQSNQINDMNNAIAGAGIALDMTCRDTQKTAKEGGRPWATAKGFDYSAPCSALMACDWQGLQKTPDFALYKNNQRVQHGNIGDMIWPIPDLLAELSLFTQLDVGDLILTGTPAGVGPAIKGDTLKAELINTPCHFEITVD